jgi:hypothetical protein
VIASVRRRTRRLTLGVLIAVALLAVLVYPAGLYVNAHLDDQPTPTTAPIVTPSRSGSVPSGATGMLPVDVEWVRLAGVDLPVSAATGPSDTSGGLARGFTHTTAGAAVAALHLLVRTTPQVGPRIFEPTVAGQVTGEHARAMRAAVADAYRQATARAGLDYGEPLGDVPATIEGVRVERYTGARVTMSVLTKAVDAAGTVRYAATALAVIWSAGDWRLVAPPEGRWDSQVRIIDPAQAAAFAPLRGR